MASFNFQFGNAPGTGTSSAPSFGASGGNAEGAGAGQAEGATEAPTFSINGAAAAQPHANETTTGGFSFGNTNGGFNFGNDTGRGGWNGAALNFDSWESEDSKKAKELEKQLKEVKAREAALRERHESVCASLKKCCKTISHGGDLTLVAQCGTKVLVDSHTAKETSPYFLTALSSGMQEEGAREVHFEDVPLAVLQVLVEGLYAGYHGAALIDYPAEHIVQVIDLSQRLLLPWIAHAAVTNFVNTQSTYELVKLMSVAEKRHQEAALDEEKKVWGTFLRQAANAVYEKHKEL